MSQELGKIDKPAAEAFKGERKLYFVPLVYSGEESPADYLDKCNRYWSQVESQINDLELKLGQATRIYHELIPVSGEEGLKAMKELNDRSYQIVKSRVDKGAQLEATEDNELLTEFIDWTRCLSIGLRNQAVILKVYESYTAASNKRNEYIAKRLDETLKDGEVGALFIRERHQVQFPSGIRVFYVAPPALDEINRWLRDLESKSKED